jgi:AhpD family alkylhydroperoxidase
MSATARVDFHQVAPTEFQKLCELSGHARSSALGPRLAELVFLRVSQINGCAYCIDMHWRSLIEEGVDPRHVNAVAGWREASFFSERERAALRWAELVNAIPHSEIDDREFEALKKHFSDEEIARLGFAICAIRSWNQLNVSFRNPIPA